MKYAMAGYLVMALLTGMAGAAPGDAKGGASSNEVKKVEMEKVTYLGVVTTPVSETLARHVGLPAGVGLVVDYVDPESPAKGALEVHDIVHKLDDQILVNHPQLAVLVRGKKAGDKVKLAVYRAGQSKEVTVTLGQKDVPKGGAGRGDFPGDMRIGPRDFRMFGPSELRTWKHGDKDMPDPLREMMQQMFENDGVMPAPPAGLPGEDDPRSPKTHKQTSHFNFSTTTPGGVSVKSFSMSGDVMTLVDGDHSLTLRKGKDGSELVATDRKGETLFKGAVDTEEQMKKVPDAIRSKVEEMKKMAGEDREAEGPTRNAM